jgi:hypothetical protein
LKLKLETKEVLNMLEGMGLLDGVKKSLQGALNALLGDAETMEPIYTMLADRVNRALDYQLHGGATVPALNGTLGQALKERIKTEVSWTDEINAALRAHAESILDHRIKVLIYEQTNQTLDRAYTALIEKHLALKVDFEKLVREEARRMLSKLSILGGSDVEKP